MIENFYNQKKIFLTGHTGFKGAWFSLFLKNLGADVYGYSLCPKKGQDSLFNLINLSNSINSTIGDIRDYDFLKKSLEQVQPEIIFHFAAQSLVRNSYLDPRYNFETNILGTVNLLEACRGINSIKCVVNITTDKCYENKESALLFKETDRLGGHDPYSSSKACSEIITASYKKSFFETTKVGLATARAGNVIGGGDFSTDRILPDLFYAIKNSNKLKIRNPNAIRPWQYILDVLFGYLILGKNLYERPLEFSEAFNFSSHEKKNISVKQLVDQFIEITQKGEYEIESIKEDFHEAKTLNLDATKALHRLGWKSKYNIYEALSRTSLWYKSFIEGKNVSKLCENELYDFMKKLV